jgi:putative membrane protein
MKKLQGFLTITFFLALAWSAYKPHDYFTWLLEVVPALVGFAVLALTYKRFQFTPMLYWLMWGHALVLIIGGHYTYAETPIGEWMKMLFGGTRNNYDKIGHFVQGFVPAMIAREILIRKNVVKRGAWLFFVVVSICLAVSAAYELVEAGMSMAAGGAADDFLGTQGYQWDTQTDMFLALIGAIIALVLLSHMHDMQLKREWLPKKPL